MATTTVTRLTQHNVQALNRFGYRFGVKKLTSTTATFEGDARTAYDLLDDFMTKYPGNRKTHPYASLHAVRRKLWAQAKEES